MGIIPQDKMPRQLISKINNYYDYIWAHSQGLNESTEIFNELSTQLKYDVMMNRFQEAV